MARVKELRSTVLVVSGLVAMAHLCQPAVAAQPAVSYSTYFGGAQVDAATAVATDANGNIYVAGWTESVDLAPTVAPQLRGSGVDAFVVKLNAAGTLVFLTVFGGSSEDKAFGIALDRSGNIYVAGSTTSPNFPITSGSMLRGSMDAFLMRLTPAGQVASSVLYGGDQAEAAYGVATDASGNVFITGETSSSNLPVLPVSTSVFAGQIDAFAAKLSPTGGVLYSRYVGGSQIDRAKGIAVDSSVRHTSPGEPILVISHSLRRFRLSSVAAWMPS